MCNFHHDDGLRNDPDMSIPDAKKVAAGRPTVVFCGIGDFNPDLLRYRSAQRQLPIQTIFRAESGDMRDYLHDFPDADFLFCA